MSARHKLIQDSELHNPKGFGGAGINTKLKKDEGGFVRYDSDLFLPSARFVDGSLSPPLTTTSTIFVLIDMDGGAVDAGWSGANYNDWVRWNGSEFNILNPLQGFICYDIIEQGFRGYDGEWSEIGGGGADIYNGSDNTPLPEREKLRVLGFLEAVDDAGNEETKIQINESKLIDINNNQIIEINGGLYLALDEDKLYQGNAQGIAVGKTLSQVLDGATDTLSASRFHLVGGFVEPYLEDGEIYVGNVNGVAIGQPIGTALDTLSVETGIRFKIGLDGKVAIDLPEGEIIKGNVNNEGVASPIISGNNKVLATDNSGVAYEADAVNFADILTGTATADGLLSTTDLTGVASGVKGSFKITNIVIENTTANAVTLDIGSDTGLDDVASAVVVGASGFVDVSVLKALFSKTVEQDIYVSSADWNSSNLIIKISVQKVF